VDVNKVADAKLAAAKEAAKDGPAIPEGKAKGIRMNAVTETTARVQSYQEFGGLAGRFALAFLAVKIASRRTLFRIFQIPSLVLIIGFYYWLSNNLQTAGTLTMIQWAMFACGFFVIAQMSFWGNYIPHAFPLHLRGTGESFAANIGGRVIGTAAAFLTLTLSASDKPNPGKMALMGAAVAGAYAFVGLILTQLLPEHDGGRAEHLAGKTSSQS